MTSRPNRKAHTGEDRGFVFEDMGSARQANIDGQSEPDATTVAKHLEVEQQILKDLEEGKPGGGLSIP